MKRVIIVGSPRSNGRCAHLAEMLFEANIDERPEDELFLVPVSEIDVGPCIGCNACRVKTPVTFKDDDGAEITEERHRCVFDDDMQTLYDLLDEADELTVVCPVFFSGAPAPMKCVIDRLQPYFWAFRENGPRLPKRPMQLHVVGEGGDPHGYAPLISEVKGPFALPGFGLERIYDWVGKISRQGEILAEADEMPVPERGMLAAFVMAEEAPAPLVVSSDSNEQVSAPQAQRGERPKLSLSGKTSTFGDGARANNANRQDASAINKGRRAAAGSGSSTAKPKGKDSGTTSNAAKGKGKGSATRSGSNAQKGKGKVAGGRTRSGGGVGKGGRRG